LRLCKSASTKSAQYRLPAPAGALDELGVRRRLRVDRSLALAYGSLQRPIDGSI